MTSVSALAMAQAPKDSTYQLTAQDSINLKQYDLKEVVVEGVRKYVKSDIDKLTYDVQADEESKTKSVLDMLRKVPLVTVDGQDKIRVKGQTAFKIYKNGHPDPSFSSQSVEQILKSMPASSIKKIEVITDPGAKYDAEGTTYILNIVMNDGTNMRGVSGNVSAETNQHGGVRSGVNITAQTGKFVFAVNYSLIHLMPKDQKNKSASASFYKDSGESLYHTFQSQCRLNVHVVDFSASYDIDSLNLLSMSLGGYYYNVRKGDVADGTTSRFDAAMQPLYSYDEHYAMLRNDYYNFNGRVDYQHKTHREGEVLTLSYMGSTTRQNDNMGHTFSNMVNMPVGYDAYKQYQEEKFFEHTWQADYVRPLGKNNTLEGGAKYIYRLNKSNTLMDYSTDDNDLHNRFKHTTQVAAAYAEWLGKYGKWSTRAGLRYEYSYMHASYPDGSGTSFHKSLSDWCPSASVQYNFDDDNNLRFNYGTSINRPGISYLNPARISTPTSLTYGNPDLNSAMTHILALTFTHTGKVTFNISPAVYITNDLIDDINFVSKGIDVSTYGNVVHEHNFWMTYYLQVNPWKGADLSFNGGTGHSLEKNPSVGTGGLSLSGWSGNGSLNLSQKLPWELMLSMGGGLNYGREPETVYGYGGHYVWNYISLQRSFLKDNRLTVRLEGYNLLHPNTNIISHTVQGDTTGWNRWEHDNRQYGISISYRFGKLNASVKHTDKTIENNDVVGGMKAGGGK